MLLSVKEAAELLRVSSKTVYRWAASGKIPYVRAGNQYRFSRAEILAWASESGRQPEPHAIREPKDSDEKLPSIYEALSEGGIFYRVSGSSASEVIEELVSVINIPPGVDRKYLYEALTAREALASTGVGKGFAIPHLRHPLPHITYASLSLAFLAEPVDWGAVDSMPVDTVFILLSPNTRCHLHLLSRLTFALQDEKWSGLLRKEAVRREILEGVRKVEEGFSGSSNRRISRA